jgi:hypothetical protein
MFESHQVRWKLLAGSLLFVALGVGCRSTDSGGEPELPDARSGERRSAVVYGASSGRLVQLSLSADGSFETTASHDIEGRIVDVVPNRDRLAVLTRRESSSRITIHDRTSLARRARLEWKGEAEMPPIVGGTWRGHRQLWVVSRRGRILGFERSPDGGEWSQTEKIALLDDGAGDWQWTEPVVYERFLFAAGSPSKTPTESRLAVVDLVDSSRIDTNGDDEDGTTPLPLEGSRPRGLSVGRGGRIGVDFAGVASDDRGGAGMGVEIVDASTFETEAFLSWSKGSRPEAGALRGARVDDATLWLGSSDGRVWPVDVVEARWRGGERSAFQLPGEGRVTDATRLDDSVFALVGGRLVRWNETGSSPRALGRIGESGGGPWAFASVRSRRSIRFPKEATVDVEGTFQGRVAPLYGPPEGKGAFKGSLDVVENVETLTVEFQSPIVDGPGADVVVFENVFNISGQPFRRSLEPARLSFSRDGQSWSSHPTELQDARAPGNFRHYDGFAGITPTYATPSNGLSPNDPAAGGDPFDLARVGLERARYLRIDYWNYDALPAIASPPDIDAIMVRER